MGVTVMVPCSEELPDRPDNEPDDPQGDCESNLRSLDDVTCTPMLPQYQQFYACTATPSQSTRVAVAGDFSFATDELCEGPMSVVVKAPQANGPVCQINLSDISNAQQNWADIQSQIEAGIENGCKVFMFPPNAVFSLQHAIAPTTGSIMPLEDLYDTIVDFNGSVITRVGNVPGIVMKNSERVIFRNGTIIGDQLIASFGRIVADPDPNSFTGFKLQPFSQFVSTMEAQFAPAQPDLITVGRARATSDPSNGAGYEFDALDSADIFTNRSAPTDRWKWDTTAKCWVSTSAGTRNDCYKVGDIIYMLHENNDSPGFVIKRDGQPIRDITLDGMTFHNISGMGIQGDIDQGLLLNNVEISPNPNDPLSGWGSSSDALHINSSAGDIVVQNSRIGPSADDLFTYKNNWWLVTAIDPVTKVVTVDNIDRKYGTNYWGSPGHRVVKTDCDRNCEQVATIATEPQEGTGKSWLVQMDSVANIAVGDFIGNPDVGGGRVLIRDNVFYGTRAQGIKVQNSHELIYGNHFENMAGPAVEIKSALEDWHEGVNTNNICVRDNTFKDTAIGKTKPKFSIWINEENCNDEQVPGLIPGIKIQNNKFTEDSNPGNCGDDGQNPVTFPVDPPSDAGFGAVVGSIKRENTEFDSQNLPEVEIYVWDSSQTPSLGAYVATAQVLQIDGTQMLYAFDSLPPGTYAIIPCAPGSGGGPGVCSPSGPSAIEVTVNADEVVVFEAGVGNQFGGYTEVIETRPANPANPDGFLANQLCHVIRDD